MKKSKLFFKTGFYFANIVLMIFYLYPGSILGWFLYNNHLIQPYITRDYIMPISMATKAIMFTSTLTVVTLIDNIRVFNEYKKMATKVNK